MPPQLMIKDKIRQSILQRGPLPNKNKLDCIIQKKLIDFINLNISNISKALLYMSYKNEVNLDLTKQFFKQKDISIYIPKIINNSTIAFNLMDEHNFVKNKYGIPESTSTDFLELSSFDIVVVPYVAIDSLGARLGYGGGYYDKAFAKSGCKKLTPFVCGLGYDYQQVDGTFGEIHDLKLKHVFTETSYFKYE